ncbi:MAG: hypothetical protein HY791_11410 [Deltaproteobacteria bacterium]|nr:hypothetical protein [Deltaproteobacteria bacterium]
MKRSFHGLGLEVRDQGLMSMFSLLARLDEHEGNTALTLRLHASPSVADVEASSREVARFTHGSIRGLIRSGGFCVFDGRSKIEVSANSLDFWVDPASLADGYTFRSTTSFIAFTLALRLRGWFHHHAGLLISTGGSPVLLLGEGGAGKTTTTLACLEAGFEYGSDDATFVTRDLSLLGTPSLFHVSERTAIAFPRLAPWLGPRYRENNDKRELDPRSAFPGQERRSTSAPRVILMPSIHAEPTELVPWSQAETFGALVTASAFVILDGMPLVSEQLDVERRLASSAVGAELRLGPDALADLSIIPRLIREVEVEARLRALRAP